MTGRYEPVTSYEILYCPTCKAHKRHRIITEHYNNHDLVAKLCLWCRNFHPFTLPKSV